MTKPKTTTLGVLHEVFGERLAQNEKWGEQNHPDGTSRAFWYSIARDAKASTDSRAKQGNSTWVPILYEEVCEAFAEEDPIKLRKELVQVAAVAVQWIECIDRRECPAYEEDTRTLAERF